MKKKQMNTTRRTVFKGMLANMLAFAGKGTYRFDGTKTDSALANARARHAYRKGWEIA